VTIDDIDLSSLFDCVIVGGGPAGLTAAVFLGRYLRKTLVVDAGEGGRNRAARGIHGFLGHHEISPEDLRAAGRREAHAVGVEFLQARAESITRSGDCFEIATTKGTARARRVLLAYGIADELPDLDRFEEYFGSSVFHCPDCDGYENRGKSIGVIGQGKSVAGLALELLQWTDRFTIFTDGEDREMDAAQISKLQAQGIAVLEDPISGLVGEDGKLTSVRLRSGESFDCEALFFTLGTRRSCSLAEDAGCTIVEGGIDIEVGERGETSVEGIWAAGDLVAGSQLVIKASADGAIAAISINQSLLPPALRI
jgi:thioredoxin reductase